MRAIPDYTAMARAMQEGRSPTGVWGTGGPTAVMGLVVAIGLALTTIGMARALAHRGDQLMLDEGTRMPLGSALGPLLAGCAPLIGWLGLLA